MTLHRLDAIRDTRGEALLEPACLYLHQRRDQLLTTDNGEEFGGMLWNLFTVHYTPKHGSWLNQAEIEISLFAGNAWADAESPRSPNSSARPALGTGA